jgi:hypothetical protein
MHMKPMIRIARRADPLRLPESGAIFAILLLSYLGAGARLIFG